jgi:hypothetical protein
VLWLCWALDTPLKAISAAAFIGLEQGQRLKSAALLAVAHHLVVDWDNISLGVSGK